MYFRSPHRGAIMLQFAGEKKNLSFQQASQWAYNLMDQFDN